VLKRLKSMVSWICGVAALLLAEMPPPDATGMAAVA
jgi:hypothetical protein